tara:strand:+ start:1664 stop:2188 length:525 start_codon:yes stop_codon:yes gene_type:complete
MTVFICKIYEQSIEIQEVQTVSEQEVTLLIENEEKMQAFGLSLGKLLLKGDVVCLTGDLGAGKTTLTKSIALGLGIDEYVTSPSYTIVNEYEGRLPLYHFDVYRINDVEEMYELGYEEYFFGSGVCVIEWAGMVEDLLPENRIWLEIYQGEQFTERKIIIKSDEETMKRLEAII